LNSEVTACLEEAIPDWRAGKLERHQFWVQNMLADPCLDCKLSQTRTNLVLYRGNPEARLMGIGEAPGKKEDLTGQVFVGQAGELGDRMFAYMGLDPDRQVYLANIVKCRPPGNRDPEPDEVEACLPYLLGQIKLVQPQMLMIMGKVAAVSLGLIPRNEPLTPYLGKWVEFQNIPTMIVYHPAFLLRNKLKRHDQALYLDRIVAYMQQQW